MIGPVRVQMVIDNRVRLPVAGLPPEALKALRAAHTHANPQREKLRRIGVPHWGEPKEIVTWRETTDEISFPRGCVHRAHTILGQWGIQAHVDDHSVRCVQEQIGQRVSLRPYQDEAVQRMLANESGIVRAPTGSGKTRMALAFVTWAAVPTIVILPNTKLLDQWRDRAAVDLGLRARDVGIVQAKNRTLRPLTLASQRTLAVHGVDDEMKRYFGAVLGDEVQLFAAKTFLEVVDPFPARYRLGMSADHRRKDGKDFLISDLFGPLIADISRADLIKAGHVLDVKVQAVVTNFRADWYGMSDDDPEKEIDWDRLLREMGDDDARNTVVLRETRRLISAGAQVLVMSHRREHCRHLDRMLVAHGVRSGVMLGGDGDKGEFDAAMRGLRSGEVRVGVGTFQSIGLGIDLPRIDAVVCATPVAGNEQYYGQVRGRACRTADGKKGATLVYVYDQHVFAARHMANLARWNNEVVVVDGDRAWAAKEWIKEHRRHDRAGGGMR